MMAKWISDLGKKRVLSLGWKTCRISKSKIHILSHMIVKPQNIKGKTILKIPENHRRYSKICPLD